MRRSPWSGSTKSLNLRESPWSGSTKGLKMRKTPSRDRPRASIPRFLCRVFGCAGQRATLILASQPPTSTGGIWSTRSSLPPCISPASNVHPDLGESRGDAAFPGRIGEKLGAELRTGSQWKNKAASATSRPAGQPEGPPGLESSTEMRARSRTTRTVIDMQQTPAARAHPEDRVEPGPVTLRGQYLPSRFQ